MKKLLIIVVLLTSSQTYSQTGKQQVPISYPVSQLLGIEYEIKDIPHPDNQRLLLIPYVALCAQRLPETDLEIYDPNSNYTIVLYSDTKCQQNKH